MNIILTNEQIYNYANNLIDYLSEDNNIKFPIKVIFYLQKNKNELFHLAQEIEQQRIEIAKKYGSLEEEKGQYNIPPETVKDASEEIMELFNLTQEVKIYKIKLEDFGDIKLTPKEMESLLFMIEEEAIEGE